MEKVPMYLSKITIPPSPEREEEQKISNIYLLHKKLWRGFAQEPNERKRDFLFRIDRGIGDLREVLVQSQSEPNWQDEFPTDAVKVKSYVPAFEKGQIFFFYLRANAVVSKVDDLNANGRGIKKPLPAADYEKWLARRADDCGFQLHEIFRMGDAVAKGSKIEKKSQGKGYKAPKHWIRLNGQNLQGHLEVTDPETFTETYTKGLGRGKAFGFGLLSLMQH